MRKVIDAVIHTVRDALALQMTYLRPIVLLARCSLPHFHAELTVDELTLVELVDSLSHEELVSAPRMLST